MPEFANPLYLALLIPLLFSLIVIYRRGKRKALLYSAAGKLAGHLTWRIALARLLPLLMVAGIALTIIALARPRTTLSRSSRSTDAIAIQMVVDTSDSMRALDLSPRKLDRDRLDVVKETFQGFIEKRPHDLIGLVSFGGYATSRVPLTIDHTTLSKSLADVSTPSKRRDASGKLLNGAEFMTAIGDALATACARLEDATPESRIVVLLSDGESNAGLITPKDATRAAKALGIRVYTIGVGSNKPAPFPIVDAFGNKRVRYVDVSFDDTLLKHIATTTGGHYFNVQDPEGLDGAMAQIDELERTTIDEEIFHLHDELFPPFLFGGGLLILLATILNGTITRQVV